MSGRKSKHPFLHVGAGISAARKSWTFAVVLEHEPSARALAKIRAIRRSAVLDTLAIAKGRRVMFSGHESESLQWTVAAVYPGAGPRAADGEATAAQWKAFNTDVDAFLLRVHAVAPIAIVIRTVDREYSTWLSSWHEWSCGELPGVLASLPTAFDKTSGRYYIHHACDLWRGWLAKLPVAEQKRVAAAVPIAARAIFAKHGGAPKVTPPRPEPDVPPSLDAQKDAWARVSREPDVLDAFAKVFAHLRLENGAWELSSFVEMLSTSKKPEDDELVVDVVRAALKAPSMRWPNTHWRPSLLESLVRLRRFAKAAEEAAHVAFAAESYLASSWSALVAYLDAKGERRDADVLYRVANKFVSYFDMERTALPKAGPAQKTEAARVFLELTAPARANLDAHDDEALSHGASLFEELAAYDARRARRLADGNARLRRGEQCDEAAMLAILKEAQREVSRASEEDLGRLTKAALRYPSLVPQLEALAYYARGNPALAMAVYRPLLAAPVPSADLGKGAPRKAWLQSANAALIRTHAMKLHEESARLADALRVHARENPSITHSAACSYAAVKRYDDAFEMVKLGVELKYDHLDKVRVDKDLGPLLRRTDFKTLFARKRK